MQLDDTIVLKYLRAKLPGLGLILPSSCTSSQFKGGQSNPTFLINCDHGAFQLVLRKAPPGPLLKSAHQVDRESTLMQRVKASNPECLVPRIYIIEQNSNILGTKFFLMEFVPGTVHRMPTLPSLAPPLRYALFNNVAAALANIHETPAEVASTPFSASVKDSASYCRRQISIWTRQFRRSSEHVQSCREMRQLLEWLEANIPEQNIRNPITRLCLVHGDFRIDNVVCEDQRGTVRAILDWELAGAGDARADLAYFCLGYYLSPEGLLGSFSYQVKDDAGTSRLQTGVPTVREFVDFFFVLEFISHGEYLGRCLHSRCARQRCNRRQSPGLS
jgi:aminoglycoside phosphotransferase (APT) family kinase protein